MALSIVDVVNNALASLGEQPIVNLDRNNATSTAILIRQKYPLVLQSLLMEADWNCARFTTKLARIQSHGYGGYQYVYQLPTDPECLHVVQISLDAGRTYIDLNAYYNWNAGPKKALFDIDRNYLLCNAPTVYIKYIGNVGVSSLDPLLASAFSAQLATELAYAITASINLYQQLFQEARRKLAKAKSRNALDRNIRHGVGDVIAIRYPLGYSVVGDTDSDIDIDADADVDIDIDSDIDTDTDLDTDQDSDTDVDTDSDYDSDSDVDTDTDTDTDVDTEDEGETLVIGTDYPIPTTVYGPSGVYTTVTRLDSPLKIGDLTNPSYGDNYYYSPQLTEDTAVASTDLYPPPQGDGWGVDNLADALYDNIADTSTNYGWVKYPSTVYDFKPSDTTTQTSYVQLGNDGQYLKSATIVMRPYICFTATQFPMGGDTYVSGTVQVLNTTDRAPADFEVIAESSVSNVLVNDKNNYVYKQFPAFTFNWPMRDPAQYTDRPGSVKIRTIITRDPSSTAYGSVTTRYGSLRVYTRATFYNNPLYLNISRTIFEDTEYPMDSVDVYLSPVDVNSFYTVSLSEEGVATVAKKEEEQTSD